MTGVIEDPDDPGVKLLSETWCKGCCGPLGIGPYVMRLIPHTSLLTGARSITFAFCHSRCEANYCFEEID